MCTKPELSRSDIGDQQNHVKALLNRQAVATRRDWWQMRVATREEMLTWCDFSAEEMERYVRDNKPLFEQLQRNENRVNDFWNGFDIKA